MLNKKRGVSTLQVNGHNKQKILVENYESFTSNICAFLMNSTMDINLM